MTEKQTSLLSSKHSYTLQIRAGHAPELVLVLWLLSALCDDAWEGDREEIAGQEHRQHQVLKLSCVLIVLTCAVKLMKAGVHAGSVRPSSACGFGFWLEKSANSVLEKASPPHWCLGWQGAVTQGHPQCVSVKAVPQPSFSQLQVAGSRPGGSFPSDLQHISMALAVNSVP